MGDINVENLIENSDNIKFDELLTTYGILRTTPRVTEESSRSIDWICTNINPELIQTSVVLSGLSDHSAQFATLYTPKPSPSTTKE